MKGNEGMRRAGVGVRNWQGALSHGSCPCLILANEFGKQHGPRTGPDCGGNDAVFPAKVAEGLSEPLLNCAWQKEFIQCATCV